MPTDSRIELHQNLQKTLLWSLLETNFSEAKEQDLVNARLNNQNNWLDAIAELERFRTVE